MSDDGFNNNDGINDNAGNADMFKHMVYLQVDDTESDHRGGDGRGGRGNVGVAGINGVGAGGNGIGSNGFGGGDDGLDGDNGFYHDRGILTGDESEGQYYTQAGSKNWVVFAAVMLTLVIVELVIFMSVGARIESERSINRASAQRIARYEAVINDYSSSIKSLGATAGVDAGVESGIGESAGKDTSQGTSNDATDVSDNNVIPDISHYLENSLKTILLPSQLSDLCKSFWRYELSINGEILPLDMIADGLRIDIVTKAVAGKSTTMATDASIDPNSSDNNNSGESATHLQNVKVIKVAAGDLNVKFAQIERPRVLPVDMHCKGALGGGTSNDDFDKHLLITSKITPSISIANDVASYSFKDLYVGQSILIYPDNILRSYIG